MLNVIFLLKLNKEMTANFNNFNYVLIPEMCEVDGYKCYQGNVNSIEQVTEIKAILDSFGDCKIIGVWYLYSGLQYGYQTVGDNIEKTMVLNEDLSYSDIEIPYPFNPTIYNQYLNDIIEYNAEGDEVSRRRPTLKESRLTQVNIWAGQTQRSLSDVSTN